MYESYHKRTRQGGRGISLHPEGERTLPRHLVGAGMETVLRHHLRHPLALGEGEAGREAEPLPGVDEDLGRRVEMLLGTVGGAKVESHAGIIAHELQPVAVDGDEGMLARGELVVRLVAVGRAGLDAEADVGGAGHGVVVQLVGLVHGPQVRHPLLQLRRGAQAGGEGMALGVELLVQGLEGAVEGQLGAPEAEVYVVALLHRVVDLLLQQVEGGDERPLAVLAPFVHHPLGDVLDAERALPYDASLVALAARQVALADAERQLAERLGQVGIR